MKVLVAADDTRSIKEVSFPKGADSSKQDAPQGSIQEFARENEHGHVQLLRVNEDKSLAITSRKGGKIHVYSLPDFDLVHDHVIDSGEVVGLEIVNSYALICSEKGTIERLALKEQDGKEAYDVEQVVYSLEPGKTVSAFAVNASKTGYSVAIGGEELDLQVLEVQFGDEKEPIKSVFKAKNVKNDRLNMRVPVWITNIAFLSDSKLITSTHYGQLRLYDITKARRPAISAKVSDREIKAMAMAAAEGSVIVTDNHSNVSKYSIDNFEPKGKYHGSTGAAQDVHASQGGYVAAAGLDRYLRVYDLNTREPVGKIFVNSQVSAVCILDDTLEDKRKSEDDELWEKLEQAPASKKRKT
uniref:Ribosome biogenesis protein NSA1 n=1 Tax=Blastobotrys adeninivorans TaxID=409370 RepID=A0A060T9A9_BLAAD